MFSCLSRNDIFYKVKSIVSQEEYDIFMNKNLKNMNLYNLNNDTNITQFMILVSYANKYNMLKNTVVQYIKKYPNKINYSTNNNNTALNFALKYSYDYNLVDIMFKNGCKLYGKEDTYLHTLCCNITKNSINLMPLFVDYINVQSSLFNRTALFHLCTNTSQYVYKMLQFLIDNGANVNMPDCTGTTALHNACKYNLDIKIIEALVNACANINAVTSRGCTPFDMAPIYAYPLFLSMDANISAYGNFKKNALEIAKMPCTYAYELLEEYCCKNIFPNKDPTIIINSMQTLGECVICYDNIADHIIQPCFHIVLCDICNKKNKIYTCPICRGPIKNINKVYFP